MKSESLATKADAVDLLGAAQNAEHDLVESVAWTQEEAALDGPGRDFDEGLLGRDKAQWSRHALYKSENGAPISPTSSSERTV